MNLGISARKKLAVFVGNIDFSQQRAGVEIDGFGGADYFAMEFATRELRQFEICGEGRREWRARKLSGTFT